MAEPAAFLHLLSQWRAIAPAPSPVSAWGERFQALKQEQAELVRDDRWLRGRDDFFGALGIQRRETIHSAALAWLMDPAARHGLGPTFLRAVLDELFDDVDHGDLRTARTTCEVTRGDRRADIVIELAGAVVVVENKVDADESQDQCLDLSRLFGDEPNVRFVFLTPDGRDPKTSHGAQFVPIGYPRLRELLAETLGAVPASASRAHGRRIAEDYLRTLKKEFTREPRRRTRPVLPPKPRPDRGMVEAAGRRGVRDG